MASLELRPNGIWHLRYRDKRGKSRSISTKIHTSPKNDLLAQKKLASFELELARGKNPVAAPLIGSLLDDVLNDYTVNTKKSASDARLRIKKHLRPWFGEMRADKLGADDWREYIAFRQTHNPIVRFGSIRKQAIYLILRCSLLFALAIVGHCPLPWMYRFVFVSDCS